MADQEKVVAEKAKFDVKAVAGKIKPQNKEQVITAVAGTVLSTGIGFLIGKLTGKKPAKKQDM